MHVSAEQRDAQNRGFALALFEGKTDAEVAATVGINRRPRHARLGELGRPRPHARLPGPDELVALHKQVLGKSIDEQWRRLRSVEIVVAKAQKEFGGEDPAHPEMRHVLDHAKEELPGLHKEAQRYTGPSDLVEPGEEEIGWVRSSIEQG